MFHRVIKDRWAYFFLLPWAVFFLIFIFYPFIRGFELSFYNFNFVTKELVYFDNYKTIFSDDLFLRSIINTLRFAIIIIPGIIIISLFIAIMINKMKTGFQNFFKAAFYLPAVTSMVSLSIVWKWIYNPNYGISNYICNLLGIREIDWLGKTANATVAVSLVVITVCIGQPIILYCASLGSIPKTYYEAAEIDGASGLQTAIFISLPLLIPTTLFILITSTIGILQMFEVVLLITSGGPQYGTTTILYLLYKTAFEFGNFGLAASMGVLLMLLIAIISFVQFKLLTSDIQY